MALKDIQCQSCQKVWEEFIRDAEDEPTKCIYCESPEIKKLLSGHGGYSIRGANGSSTRPKHSGSYKRSKE